MDHIIVVKAERQIKFRNDAIKFGIKHEAMTYQNYLHEVCRVNSYALTLQ